jgi:ketoreductase
MEKIAVITGASGGIGWAIARQLCADGYAPILIARNPERLAMAVASLQKIFPSRTILSASCDVSDRHAVSAFFKKLKDDGVRVSVLVNGAGISGGGISAQISDEAWLNVINSNLNSMFFVTRNVLALELMPKGGRIINIASTGGKQGVLHGSPYCASKHGMVGFTKALGLELARNQSGITVNAVCPGFVETEMAQRVRDHYAKIWGTDEAETRRRVEERVPLGRYVEPDEVAAMVSYLVSPLAAAVTAQAMNVCGGLGNY